MHEHDHLEDHDRGLNHDLEVMATRALARRKLLSLFAVGGAGALITACGGGGSSSSSGTTSTTTSSSTTTGTTTTTTGTTTGTTTTTTGTTTTTTTSCLADPTETNGPYPSDGTNSVNGVVSNSLTSTGIVRSDIRSSFGSYSGTAEGVPLTLTIKVVNTNSSCANLSGYAVYIWHCTREGTYSLYTVTNQNYLRGVQVTDSNGEVTFTTIFPGCYSGRWPHIHFEVFPSLATATTQRNASLTSQFAMPSATASTVYNGATGYSASVTNLASISLSSDNVFGDNTSAQITAMTPTMTGSVSAGYTATVTVGIAV